MKIKIFLSIFYILFIFNSNLLSDENNKTLKVGLLAPLSGPHSEIGNSLLYSLQLALEEIEMMKMFHYSKRLWILMIKKNLKSN